MNRTNLIKKIVDQLDNVGALDRGNYNDIIDQQRDVYDVVEECLKDLIMIQGEIVE